MARSNRATAGVDGRVNTDEDRRHPSTRPSRALKADRDGEIDSGATASTLEWSELKLLTEAITFTGLKTRLGPH